MIIKPQPGFQEQFLSSSADIVIGGGSAGSGKTYAELLEPLRHINVPGFKPVIFRRTTTQIMAAGGLWDAAMDIYPNLGGIGIESKKRVVFESGSTVTFAHLEYEKDKYNYQGTEIPLIMFDELTHFTWGQFIYMLSRNRSTCGVRPYMRATCNPDADSWVRDFIDWWIDENGFIIPERNGILRYFTLDGDNVVWGNSAREVADKCPHVFDNENLKDLDINDLVKSVTFIEGDIYDNKELLRKDPGYLGNLLALPTEEKSRLLEKNWNIKIDGSMLCELDKIGDIFTNQVKEDEKDKCITIDHARFGQDLLVEIVWKGWKAMRIDVLTKSDTNDIVKITNKNLFKYRIGSSAIIIDQDGIGVKDHYKNCDLFLGGGKTIGENKEVYKNLKTQCSYYVAEEVINKNLLSIDLGNIYVDGVASESVKIKGKSYDIKALIEKQIRTLRQKDVDKLGKKQIESKEEQKNKLNGLSPDFLDAIVMKAKRNLRGERRGISRK